MFFQLLNLCECIIIHMHILIYSCFHVLQEKDARDIEIPNIRWEVFELMMRFNGYCSSSFFDKSCVWWVFIIYWRFIFYSFIYTGSVDVTLDIAQDLLRAADQYLLEGLKRLCEYTIAQVSYECWFTHTHTHTLLSPFWIVKWLSYDYPI